MLSNNAIKSGNEILQRNIATKYCNQTLRSNNALSLLLRSPPPPPMPRRKSHDCAGVNIGFHSIAHASVRKQYLTSERHRFPLTRYPASRDISGPRLSGSKLFQSQPGATPPRSLPNSRSSSRSSSLLPSWLRAVLSGLLVIHGSSSPLSRTKDRPPPLRTNSSAGHAKSSWKSSFLTTPLLFSSAPPSSSAGGSSLSNPSRSCSAPAPS